MNPMNRRMFRDPMMARRAAGILASSPELMAAAQRRMNNGGVIKAANGVAARTSLLNTPSAGQFTSAVQRAITMGDAKALQELAKPVNYGAAARTPDGKAAIAMATQALGSLKKAQTRVSDDASRQAENIAGLQALRSRISADQSLTGGPESQVDMAAGDQIVGIKQPLSDVMAGIMSQADASIAAEAAKFPGQTGFDKDMERTGPVTPRRVASIDVDPSVSGPTDDEMQAAMIQKAQETKSPLLSSIGDAFKYVVGEIRDLPGDLAKEGGRIADELKFGTPRRRGKTELGRDPGPVEQDAATDLQRIVSAQTGENINVQTSPSGAQFAGGASVPDYGSGIPPGTATNTLTTGADLVEAPRGAGENLAQTVTKPDDPSDNKQTKPVNKKVVPPANKSSLDDAEDQDNQSQIVLTPDAANKITSNDPDVSNDAAQTTGNALVDKALSILQGSGAEDKSEKEKAEAVDDVVGITGKTREERVRKRKQLLKDMLGEREKDIRTDANYNLIMTGLMVAAGESPDAMTNLAKGLAVGFKGYGDAIGEEAKAITKEDRELTIQAFAEVGAEISAEEAAAIKASENALTRAHESKMQNTRLATGLIQAAAQIGSRENIANMQISSNEKMALAKIRSSEMLAANTLEQNANIFNVSTAQKERLAADANALKERLADLPSAEMRKVEAIQADVLKATGEELSTLDAFAALSAATASTKSPTDTQIAYGRLIDAGMKPADAFVFSQSGVLKSIFSELGPEEAQNLIISKMNQGQQGQQQTSGAKVPSFDTKPSDETLTALTQAGVTQVTIGGKTFNITPK